MATEYFIKADGHDDASGRSEEQAWATYPKALPRLTDGDTLTQVGGIAGDLLIDSQTQTFADRITVRGKPGTLATMTPYSDHAIRFYARPVDGLVLRDLVLDARHLPPVPAFLPILFADACAHTQFLNVEIRNHKGIGSQFGYNSHDCLWDGGGFYDIGDHACYMVGHRNTFRRFRQQRIGRYGFHVYSMEGSHDRCSWNVIEDGAFSDIGLIDPTAAAIVFAWGHDNVARNNRITRAQVGLANYTGARANRFLFNSLDTCRIGLGEQYYAARAEFVGNVVAFSTKFAYVDVDTLSQDMPPGNFVGDPLWVGGEDYHVRAGSPCIAAIDRRSDVPVDADGRARLAPTTYGAYEFIADAPPEPEPEPPPDAQTFEVVGGSLTLRPVARRR